MTFFAAQGSLLEAERKHGQSFGDDLCCLREEFAALSECLIEAGLLKQEHIAAKIHRRRFASVVAEHPMRFEGDHDLILSTSHFLVGIGQFLGPRALQVLSLCARGVGEAASTSRCLVKDRWSGYIYLFGGSADGRTNLDTLERFLPETGAWETLPNMLQKRQGIAFGVTSGKLFICGGRTDDAAASRTVECFHADSRAWEVVPPMCHARQGAAAGVLDGRLYVCGGSDGGGVFLSSVERYDPASLTWEELQPMRVIRVLPAFGVLNNKLHLCGGSDGGEVLASAECFNPYSEQWEQLPPMLEHRYAAGAAAWRSSLYVCGGRSYNMQVLSTVECFDSDALVWTSLRSMQIARRGFGVAIAAGGLYVFGGFSGSNTLRSIERYDLKAEKWMTLEPMSNRRWAGAAAHILY